MAVKEYEVDMDALDDAREKAESIHLEVQRLKFLQHPNIVQYMGAEIEENDSFLTLRIFQEPVTAGNISTVISAYGPLDDLYVRKYTKQILQGLEYLHSKGVPHLDLKISNVLLDNMGNLRLTDFGISEPLNELMEGYSSSLKNPHYWPYEEADSTLRMEKYKMEDIAALGAILMEMTGGQHSSGARTILSKEGKEFMNLCIRCTQAKSPLDVSTLLLHPFVKEISSTIHDFIPITPPQTPPPALSPIKQSTDSMRSSIEERMDLLGSTESLGFPRTASRYKNDFEELEELGSGGFGVVVKARNRLDGRYYAVKKVKLNMKHHASLSKMVREVTTLSRLNHQYVVRYYQAWLEGVDNDLDKTHISDSEDEDWLSSSVHSQSGPQESPPDQAQMHRFHRGRMSIVPEDDDSDDDNNNVNKHSPEDVQFEMDSVDDQPSRGSPSVTSKVTVLYIQMEYCDERTLRQLIDDGLLDDEEERWRLLRQIVEGLNHIHQQGIIHRDLKPSNIFLDMNGDVKIGDFGLATTGIQKVSLTNSTDDFFLGVGNQNNTTRPGVGTPFYTSPEQDKIGYNYDFKVDMYSLGIIFFEMCCQFSTGMERAMALTALRKDGGFPAGFEAQHHTEAELIKMLLQENPNDRPDTLQLLQSNILPSKMEEELLKQAMTTITNPTTTLFGTLVEHLFSREPDKHLDFTYNYHIGSNFLPSDLILRGKIAQAIANICKRHGGLLVETPLLIPKNNLLQHHNLASLMDDTGTLLTLPYDLTLPFARYIARNRITNLKRYNFSRVYRKHAIGGKPRELYEWDFDIVAPHSSSSTFAVVHDAEVMKVVTEILDHFGNAVGAYHIRVNHCKLFDAVLSICGVDPASYDHVRAAISNLAKSSWSQVTQRLLHKGHVTPAIAESMSLYFSTIAKIPGMDKALLKLEPLIKRNKNAREAFVELKYLVRHLKAFGILNKVSLDLSCIFNQSYYDGILFQAVLENDNHTDIIAAGGRYDKLVREFLPPNGYLNCSAVGVNIAFEKILSCVTLFEQKAIKKTNSIKLRTSEADVFVCSVGKNLLEERMQIANEFWQADIKTEYLHSEKLSLEDLYMQCISLGIPWMVILKEGAKGPHGTGIVRVKNVETKTEVQVSRAELTDHMCQVLQLKPAPPTAPPRTLIPSGSTTQALLKSESAVSVKLKSESAVSVKESVSAPPTPNVSAMPLDVVIIGHDNLHSKQKRKIMTMATSKLTPMCAKLTAQSHGGEFFKIGAVDVPANVLKDVATTYDSTTENMPILDKYPRFRDKMLGMLAFLNKHKATPIIFLYSCRDDTYEIVLMR